VALCHVDYRRRDRLRGAIVNLLSDKPRDLKRFVNTYRLLKASSPDIESRRTSISIQWKPLFLGNS
jgi:hypothetical protein